MIMNMNNTMNNTMNNAMNMMYKTMMMLLMMTIALAFAFAPTDAALFFFALALFLVWHVKKNQEENKKEEKASTYESLYIIIIISSLFICTIMPLQPIASALFIFSLAPRHAKMNNTMAKEGTYNTDNTIIVSSSITPLEKKTSADDVAGPQSIFLAPKGSNAWYGY